MLEEAAHRFVAGQVVGHYHVLANIGQGGMGDVWLADDLSLHRKVALKVLHPQLARKSTALQRFSREARAASALNHPNIATIYEIGNVDGLQFLAIEFIEGVTLRQRLAGGPRIEIPEAAAIMKQILSAVEAAHRAGIIHRDIKPENVMIRPDGLVKVLDFGLARVTGAVHLDETESTVLTTSPGLVIGTPAYMSPEQARGLDVDARSEVFSLGVVLYEMITGHRPFQGKTWTDLLLAIVSSAPPPLSASLPDASPELQRILDTALAKEPEKRYASVRDFGADVDRFVRVPAVMDSAPPRQLPPAQSRYSSKAAVSPLRRAVWASSALVVLGILAFATYRSYSTLSVEAPEPRFVPLIGLPGGKKYASFSPEETRIAFSWDGGADAQVSPRDIYVKEIGAGEPVRLTAAPEDDIMPTWTPDGRFITFERVYPDKHLVYKIPATGGREQKIAETGWGSSWSPDGKTLAVTGIQTAKARDEQIVDPRPGWDMGAIILMDINSGQRSRLTTPPPSTIDESPAFSPDGKWVAFVRLYGVTEGDVWIANVRSRSERRLTSFRGRLDDVLSWTRDSQSVVFGATRNRDKALWRVSLKGGEMKRLPLPGENSSSPAISRSGSKLAWLNESSDSNIWRATGPGFGNRSEPGQFGPLLPFIMFSREDHSPEFSPDGTRVVFASGRTGGEDLWVCDRDGHNAVQLTNQGGPTGTPHWSPDGRWIAFDSNTGGNNDIYVMSPEGGPWRKMTFEPSWDSQPAWSHDGRWIYFKSDRSRRGEMWRVPSSGGRAVQITHTGAMEGFESPDGKLLYFSKGRGVYGLWSVPVDGGPEAPVPELKDVGYWRSWGVLKQGIYFISKEPRPRQTIRFYSFATHRITPLLVVDKWALWWQSGLALSPDGTELLFAQLDHAVNEIMMMENFR